MPTSELKGWTLQETMLRVTPSFMREELERLRTKVASVGGYVGPRTRRSQQHPAASQQDHPASWPDDGLGRLTLANPRQQVSSEQIDISKQIDSLRSKLEQMVVDLLVADRLVASGMPAGKGDRRQIAAELWLGFRCINWNESRASEGRRKHGRTFDHVCVMPAFMAPDGVKRVTGLTLEELFDNHLVGDPEVEQLADAAIKANQTARSMFHEGWFSGWTERPWPAQFEAYDFAAAAVSMPSVSLESSSPVACEAVCEAASALKLRYAGFLEQLRSGLLVAKGMPNDGSSAVPISRAIWGDSATTIDFRNNRVSEMWNAVELEASQPQRFESGGHVEKIHTDADQQRTRHKGGAPARYDWDNVRDELLIKFGKSGYPETQSEFIRWVQDIVAQGGGTEPDESTVRAMFAKYLPKISRLVKMGE